MTHVVREPRWLGPAALVVFALSGCSGLIYQSIWTQYLGLYLGHAAYAQSLVLAIFMGGMAIGAWWASRRSQRWRNLLFAYAAIELVIGIAAAVFHPVYSSVTSFAYATAFPALPAWAVQAFKWTSGTLLILPQAILLGTTFPLMTNGLMRRLRGHDGAILGGLYFTNSIGAAAGALLATFVLLPAIGMPGAMRFGAVLNVVVALAAFLIGRRAGVLDVTAPAVRDTSARSGTSRLLLVAAFVTGATSFVYEIGWVRMLSLAFGSTVHAFELMLAAFIGGLAFGGLWIRRRIDAYAEPIRVGGIVQVLMGLAALASLVAYDHTFDWVAWLLKSLNRNDNGYVLYNVVTASVSILIMAPAAFFAGMTLPLFTLSLIRAGGGEAAVGRIYAANTVGAILGVFAAVHFLVPVLGLKLAMIIAAAGDLVLGIVLLRRWSSSADSVDFAYLGTLATSGIALAATLMLARFDPGAMASGVYRSGMAHIHDTRGEKVLYYRDGKTASVAVIQSSDDKRAIKTNGKVDAGLGMGTEPGPDESTMILAAAVPLLHHPHPANAAVIGFGSGLSTHTLLADPRLQRVDTIEIEPAMIEGARLFGKRVERAYADPRSHLHIEDARTYFAANHARYDIIVAEPSNPWVSGVASLFSTEFYTFIPHHLAPGGLFVQWVQLYEINDELVGTIVQALSTHFRDYRVYLANDADMLIVASADGTVPDPNPAALTNPVLRDELARVNLGTLPDIEAHALGRRDTLASLFITFSRRANSDYFPILSLEAPRTRYTAERAATIKEMSVADLPYREIVAGLPTSTAAGIADEESLRYARSVHHAARLSTALMREETVSASDAETDSAPVALLREAVAQCRHTGDPATPMSTLVDIAARTLPFLPPEEGKALWTHPTWIHCNDQAPAIRALLDVIAALAARDGAAVQHNALQLLARDGAVRAEGLRDWLLRAAMLGAYESGDFAAVEQIEADYGRSISSTGSDLYYRTWVRNAARLQMGRP
ncbi:MAG: spermine synthase [Dokdonella sp.]|uniref:spermine/spermidine synthase domain-containing protein n=1 Tax=Dokdonella sp. TaxID=2291710 RepID=UPI003F7DC73A